LISAVLLVGLEIIYRAGLVCAGDRAGEKMGEERKEGTLDLGDKVSVLATVTFGIMNGLPRVGLLHSLFAELS
jgi:hypothetical protein